MKYGEIPVNPRYIARIKGDAGSYEVWGFNWHTNQVLIFRAGELDWVPAVKVKLEPLPTPSTEG